MINGVIMNSMACVKMNLNHLLNVLKMNGHVLMVNVFLQIGSVMVPLTMVMLNGLRIVSMDLMRLFLLVVKIIMTIILKNIVLHGLKYVLKMNGNVEMAVVSLQSGSVMVKIGWIVMTVLMNK